MSAAQSKRGLGTGLDALFGDTRHEIETGARVLPISKIEPRAGQPRAYFDEEALAELAESIKEHGLLQPLTVRKLESGYYQIIAGERRWRASRLAGLTELPVNVIAADDRLATELALVENLQREDLNPVEEALGYRSLIDEYGLTQEEASRRVGKSRPAVANSMRLLSLCGDVLNLVEQGLLSPGHARALIPVQPDELQLEAANLVLTRSLSVRKTEELARRLMQEKPEAKSGREALKVDYLGDVAKRVELSLGRRVLISESGKRGRVTLEYYGKDDREALFDALLGLKKRNME